jgi:hypothetical protein
MVGLSLIWETNEALAADTNLISLLSQSLNQQSIQQPQKIVESAHLSVVKVIGPINVRKMESKSHIQWDLGVPEMPCL